MEMLRVSLPMVILIVSLITPALGELGFSPVEVEGLGVIELSWRILVLGSSLRFGPW